MANSNKLPTQVENNQLTQDDSLWVNLNNAKTNDGNDASNPFDGQGVNTAYLMLSDFDFNIPTSGVIDGISVTVERYRDPDDNVYDESIKLFSGPSKTFIGDDKAGSPSVTWGTSPSTASYGSPSDKWGTTITSSDVNDPNFGVGIRAYAEFGGYGTPEAFVDYVEMTVFYTEVPPLLLDIYTAERGLSLRKLRTAYNGPCVRLVRESDESEQDIGFDGNEIDVAAIETFCSGTVGYIIKWYDQIGSGDAYPDDGIAQPTISGLPFIYSGALVTNEFGRPVIRFVDDNQPTDGARCRMFVPNWVEAESSGAGASQVYSSPSLDGSVGMQTLWGSPIRSIHLGAGTRPYTVIVHVSGNSGASSTYNFGRNETKVRFDTSNRTVVQTYYDTDSSPVINVADLDEPYGITNTYQIGARSPGNLLADTFMSEIIGYNTDQTSNNLAIRTDQYNYWTSGAVPTTLSVSDASQSFGPYRTSHSFNVTSDGTWSWSCDADWVEALELLNQTGNQEFTYTVMDNLTTSERTATITFASSGLSATHSITQASGTALVTDNYTAEIGFSLRKIRLDYDGKCIRVIRDSDSEVQDIGFISGILDTGAIHTFCSGTRCRVVKWYDQVGSGLAFPAGSVSGDSFPGSSLDRSPFIYESGAVVVNEHGLPALRFLDDNSTYAARLDMTSFYTESAPYVAYASVYSILDSGIGVYNTSPIIGASNVERGLTVFHDGDQAEKQPKATVYRSGAQVQTFTSTEVPRNTTTSRFDYADRSFVKIFLNKEESAVASQTDRDEDFNTLLITTIGGRNASVIEGEILLSELIGFTVDQTSGNLAIRTELYDFWTSGVTPSSLSPKYGETEISKVYFGSTQISKIMHGNTQIF